MIRDLATAIIRDGKVPSDWEQSFTVCLYKGKGDALDRGNYRGLKLTEQAMKILERIVDGLIRQVVSIEVLSQEEALQMQSAAGEIPSSEQEALYGHRGPRENI